MEDVDVWAQVDAPAIVWELQKLGVAVPPLRTIERILGRAAATLRRRLFSLLGRLTRTARRWTLHLPARWPWAQNFIDALTRIRALPHAA